MEGGEGGRERGNLNGHIYRERRKHYLWSFVENCAHFLRTSVK